MSAIQSTIGIIGLAISLMCLGYQGSRDYREPGALTTALPTIILAVVVGIDLFGRIWP